MPIQSRACRTPGSCACIPIADRTRGPRDDDPLRGGAGKCGSSPTAWSPRAASLPDIDPLPPVRVEAAASRPPRLFVFFSYRFMRAKTTQTGRKDTRLLGRGRQDGSSPLDRKSVGEGGEVEGRVKAG